MSKSGIRFLGIRLFHRMNSSHTTGIFLASAAVVIGGAIFFITASGLYPLDDSSIAVATSTPVTTPPIARPDRLVIPAIRVDAAVEEVGVTSDGAMATPKKAGDVGWYKFGTSPGEVGSAVIDGHVDNTFAFPGVFRDLKKLQVGDDVYVETKAGERLRFVVTDVRSFPYESVPTREIFLSDDGAHLNLITCGGKWLPAKQTYDHRIVVYTRLADN